ncbi:glycoside hydrolase family 172 protein [Echinicola rosea]|nr:glycoside hydrolase family 172 protein [Echinicola rosea]
MFLLVMVVFYSCGTSEEKEVAYEEVVRRLMDMKALAKLPGHGEKSAMWSSYDRESKIDESGKFINWDANIDGLKPQYIRKEGDKEVLAEMEGPGAIVRIWSASPAKGHVKIYIDGNEQPVIDLPFIDYFKPSIPAFEYPALVYETNARGFNNYVPITYNTSCKVVADPGWGQYYHFNYISFADGKTTESYTAELSDNARTALKEVNDFFTHKMGNSPYQKGEFESIRAKEKIPAGHAENLLSIEGSGAIASLKIRMDIKDEKKRAEAMRKVTISMRWDGSNEDAVWAPLGDFFGSAPGKNLYKTLPMGMTEEWMYSYWYMPFEDGAEITVTNDFDEDIEIFLEVEKDDLEDFNKDEIGRFHAKWHRDLKNLPKERWPDWTLLETQGSGRFVGTQLTVWNPKGGSCSLGGPGHWWWGEGDEKFFIDGEKFPSIFGTGTEDYFGYAWCDPTEFEQAFHSQSMDNDNMGYQPMNRWHITDNIPFQQSFQGYLEKYFPNNWPTQYSTVVYWYLEPGGEDPLKRVAVKERYGFETPYEVYREEGVVEGEELAIEKNTGGWATVDSWANEKLYTAISGHKVLLWNAAPEKDNELDLRIPSDYENGRYKVYANVIKNKEGGEFILVINGEEMDPIDCFIDQEGIRVEEVYLGKAALGDSETNTIKLVWKGEKNKGRTLKIDYLKIQK